MKKISILIAAFAFMASATIAQQQPAAKDTAKTKSKTRVRRAKFGNAPKSTSDTAKKGKVRHVSAKF